MDVTGIRGPRHVLGAGSLQARARGCTICAPVLPHPPRPVFQFAAEASLVIIGQAPGSRVHASGIPWADDSGARLRAWLDVDEETFYRPDCFAFLPMGFCFPGTNGRADLPPRPECAPVWHPQFLEKLPSNRLILLVGTYAQARYLRCEAAKPMTERVRGFARHLPRFFPLPHPSWRSVGWMQRNPWFEAGVLPALRAEVLTRLGKGELVEKEAANG